jgi:hypothetical protein
MEKEIWTYIEKFIKSSLSTVQSELDSETVDSVNHYLDNAEYEMAFEGLFIEIMKLRNKYSVIELSEVEKVGRLLKLHEHSTFDDMFWDKLESYLKENK